MILLGLSVVAHMFRQPLAIVGVFGVQLRRRGGVMSQRVRSKPFGRFEWSFGRHLTQDGRALKQLYLTGPAKQIFAFHADLFSRLYQQFKGGVKLFNHHDGNLVPIFAPCCVEN